MLQIRTLGRFAVTVGDQVLSIPGVRDRALLAFLAITGKQQSRERLVGLLWANRDEEQARQSLRQSLTTLRKLGVPILADGRERVGLGSVGACDVQTLSSYCKGGSLDQLRQIAELYEGSLIADWTGGPPEFEEWLSAERNRFASMAAEAIMRLVTSRSPRLAAADRFFFSRKVLGADPYHEEAHQEELLALIDMGLRGEAILAHQNFAALLQNDLGIKPNDVTRKTAALAMSPSRQASGMSATVRPRLAIFPLPTRGADNDHQHLARGIMSEIASALSQFASLQVIAPQSSFRLAGEADRLEQAVRSLRANFVIEGALGEYPGGIEMRLDLIDLASGSIVFTEGRRNDGLDYAIFSRQVAHSVASRIDDRIEQLLLSGREATDPARLTAWDLWLRGQHCMEKWDAEQEDKTEDLFRRAVAADPTLARAHSSLSLLLNGRILVKPGMPFDCELRKEAFALARRAVDLDPQDARSHLAMTWVSLFMCDRQRGIRHAKLAHELNPHSADVLMHVGLAKAYLGDASDGLLLADEAFDLNPLFPDWYVYFKAEILVLAGMPRNALEFASSMASSFGELAGWLVIAAAEAGDEAAMREMKAHLLRLTRAAWAGKMPWSEALAVEWFLSVNRWLAGRERDLMIKGLLSAGLLPVT